MNVTPKIYIVCEGVTLELEDVIWCCYENLIGSIEECIDADISGWHVAMITMDERQYVLSDGHLSESEEEFVELDYADEMTDHYGGGLCHFRINAGPVLRGNYAYSGGSLVISALPGDPPFSMDFPARRPNEIRKSVEGDFARFDFELA